MVRLMVTMEMKYSIERKAVRKSLQMGFTQRSGLKTADWASVPLRQSSSSHLVWGRHPRKMELAKKARECGGEEAVLTP